MLRILLAGIYPWIHAVRLGVSDDMVKSRSKTPDVDEVTPEGNDLVDAIIALGQEKCTALVTSSSTYSHFKTDLQLFYYQEPHKWPDYQSFANWRWGAQPYWILQQKRPSVFTFPFPLWDNDDTKFRIQLRQYPDKTVMTSEFRNIPARRLYIVIIGEAEEAEDSSRKRGEWTPETACDGETQITYTYIIDIFLTGDDFTNDAWPKVKYNMGEHRHIGDESSYVNVRKGEKKFEGEMLSELGKSRERKGFWILDATYVDYVDRVIGDSGERLRGKKVKDTEYVSHTFWETFKGNFKDIDDQEKAFKNPENIWWLTDKFEARRLNVFFPGGGVKPGEQGITVWRPKFTGGKGGSEVRDEADLVVTPTANDGTAFISGFKFPGYNGGSFNGRSTRNLDVRLFLPVSNKTGASEEDLVRKTKDLEDMNDDEFLMGIEGLIKDKSLFTQFTYEDDHAIGNILPIIVCGLFSKVWPVKTCAEPKPEEEA